MCEHELLTSSLSKVIVLHITARECMHLVARGHFRSHDKDGGHTIRSVVAKSPMIHVYFVDLL